MHLPASNGDKMSTERRESGVQVRQTQADLPVGQSRPDANSLAHRRNSIVFATETKGAGVEYCIMDVFTKSRYQGNSLAVVFDQDRRLTKKQKQQIAKEFNLAETIYVGRQRGSSISAGVSEKDVLARWPVEIFTTTEELSFAGHPVIGAASALGLSTDLSSRCGFEAKAGLVSFNVKRQESAEGIPTAQAEVHVPHDTHLHQSRVASKDLHQSRLQLSSDSSHPAFTITKGMTYVLIEVPSFEALGQAELPKQRQGIELDAEWKPSFVGYYFYYREPASSASSHTEIHTRMLEPAMGEDPATGSAASCLTGYLATEMARTAQHRDFSFVVTQGEHLGRKGTMQLSVAVDDQGQISDITLSGNAVRIMKGFLEV